jgi:hypothetical protein
MWQYKRNQVEEAITAALQQAEREPDADLRVRLKRLLDTDHTLGSEGRGSDPANAYAFSTGERPGRGVEVWFSAYEAFALLLGVLLLEHRWPQRTAVRIMRLARPALEPEHARILSLDPKTLLDRDEVARQAAPGRAAFDSSAEVFLAIVSGGRAERLDPEALPHAIQVCRGEGGLMRFRRERAPVGTSMTVLELTGPAHLLSWCLNQTKPRTRGRPGR